MSGTVSHIPQRPDGEKVARVQTLFVQHSPALRGFVLSLLPDFAAVDDVLQETFLTLTAKAGEFEPGTSFLRWACAIARFKVIEYGRRNARGPQSFSPEVIESLCASEPAEVEHSEDWIGLLAECVGRLAPKARRAVELRYQHAAQAGGGRRAHGLVGGGGLRGALPCEDGPAGVRGTEGPAARPLI